MNAIKYIRTQVFKVTQSEFAEIAGVRQATVSRWENGVAPTLDEMTSIRAGAIARGLDWDDGIFFNIPEVSP